MYLTAKNNILTFLFQIKYWLLVVGISCNLGGCIESANVDAPKAIKENQPIDPYNLQLIDSVKGLLKEGDLVTRSDSDYESMSLQNFSKRERTYSHSGILFKDSNQLYVYHSMGGHENPSGWLKKEPFDSFVNPTRKTGFGIFRYNFSEVELKKFHAYYDTQYHRKVPFDKHFNLVSNDSMYCSEIIYKALKESTDNRILIAISSLSNFTPKNFKKKDRVLYFKKFDFIGIDDLYLNNHCKEIKRIVFK